VLIDSEDEEEEEAAAEEEAELGVSDEDGVAETEGVEDGVLGASDETEGLDSLALGVTEGVSPQPTNINEVNNNKPKIFLFFINFLSYDLLSKGTKFG